MNRGDFHRPAGLRRAPRGPLDLAPPSRFSLFMRRMFVRLSEPPLRHVGLMLFIWLLAGTGAYGAVRGGHAEAFSNALHEAGDAIARGFGLGIVRAEVSGNRYLSGEEILERAGITAQTSLLLLDVEGVRGALKEDARVAEASVRKFYPDRLEIVIEERAGYARWQRSGKTYLIARDGTVLESDIGGKSVDLPLVIGLGAEKRAAAFLDLIARYPSVREVTRAGILVAERRWNLRLKNGIDVRLPEEDPALALERLVLLDKSQQIMTRDVTVIDLRVPDRVAVGLTDETAAALKKDKPQKRKGDESAQIPYPLIPAQAKIRSSGEVRIARLASGVSTHASAEQHVQAIWHAAIQPSARPRESGGPVLDSRLLGNEQKAITRGRTADGVRA